MPVAHSFSGALGALYAAEPVALPALVQALGGTRKAAQELGVSQRTIQRYITTGKERRGQGASALSTQRRTQAVRALQQASAHERLRREGLHVKRLQAQKVRFSSERARERDLNYAVDIDGDELGEMIAALELGDEDLAESAFSEAYAESFIGVGGDIEGITYIDIDMGTAP